MATYRDKSGRFISRKQWERQKKTKKRASKKRPKPKRKPKSKPKKRAPPKRLPKPKPKRRKPPKRVPLTRRERAEQAEQLRLAIQERERIRRLIERDRELEREALERRPRERPSDALFDRMNDLVSEAAEKHGGSSNAAIDSIGRIWVECIIPVEGEDAYETLLDLENVVDWTSFDGWIRILMMVRAAKELMDPAKKRGSPLGQSMGLFEIGSHWYRSKNAHLLFLYARIGMHQALIGDYPDADIAHIKIRLQWNPENRKPEE